MASCIDQDLGFFFFDRSVLVDLHLPLAGVFVPDGLYHLGVELHLVIEIPFAHCTQNVLLDLGAGGIELGPVGIGLEQKGICIYCG